MIYSYTQLASYLNCPRAYRHHYVDGWHEKDSRAAMVFGRVFEKALGAYFRHEDSTAALFEEWQAFQNEPLQYAAGDSWDRMLHQGVALLNRFAQDDRIHISRPRHDLQIKCTKPLSGNDAFVAHVDAIGTFEGERCLIEWKTTSRRYPEGPPNLFSLDPQLICYSWVTAIPDLVMVVFVRKQQPEIQYLPVTISDDQRLEFERLARVTIEQIDRGLYAPHPGVRFPHNQCVSCSNLGLCLNDPSLVEGRLVKAQEDNLVWLDELDY